MLKCFSACEATREAVKDLRPYSDSGCTLIQSRTNMVRFEITTINRYDQKEHCLVSVPESRTLKWYILLLLVIL